MILDNHLLAGARTSEKVITIAKYTRKKAPSSGPPRPKDSMAWKHNGSDGPELVFRHPSMPGIWLTSKGLAGAVERFAGRDIPFLSRKGSMPLLAEPTEGMQAWVKLPRHRSRALCVLRDGAWYQIAKSDDGP